MLSFLIIFNKCYISLGSASQKQYKSCGGGPGIKVKKAGTYNVPATIILLLYNYEGMQVV